MGSLICLAVVLGLSTQAHAQTQEENGPKSRKKPHEMTLEELKEAGFQWEPEARHDGSLVGGLIAAGPGLLVHGMGHYYVNDPQAGLDLITLEFLFSVPVMVAGGLLIATADDGKNVQSNSGLVLLQAGGVLFATSYAADIIGATKGTESDLPRLSKRLDGLRTRSGYTFLVAEDLPCTGLSACHLADLGLEADLGAVVLFPYTRLDLAGDYEELGLDLEWRTVPGQTPQEYGGLGVSLSQVSFTSIPDVGETLQANPSSESVIRLEAALSLSLDMSSLLAHLKNVLVQTSGGVGFSFDGGTRAAVPGGSSAVYVFVKHGIAFLNVIPQLMIRPYYVFSEAEVVAPLSFWVGTFGSEVVWTPLTDLDVYVDGLVGGGLSISSGVRYNFWEQPPSHRCLGKVGPTWHQSPAAAARSRLRLFDNLPDDL